MNRKSMATYNEDLIRQAKLKRQDFWCKVLCVPLVLFISASDSIVEIIINLF